MLDSSCYEENRFIMDNNVDGPRKLSEFNNSRQGLILEDKVDSKTKHTAVKSRFRGVYRCGKKWKVI